VANVVVTVLIPGDVEMFRQSLNTRSQDYRTIAERAQQAGAVHHRFAIPTPASVSQLTGTRPTGSASTAGNGLGWVMVTDEWETEDQFRRFFEDPELQTFIKSVGGSGSPPQIVVAEALDSPDQF
jgi:hypothetical protein